MAKTPTVLGVDIGGTAVKVAVMFDGKWLTGKSPFYARPTSEELRNAIRVACKPLAAAVPSITAVGMCVPGILDPAGERVTLSVNVPGLVNLQLRRLAAESLGVDADWPVTIFNDAGAAARDVYAQRKLTGRMWLLTLGTGIGAAVVHDGKPLFVEGNSPGHIGQVDVSVAGHDVIGPDGGAGGLEGYIGVGALKRDYGSDIDATLERFNGTEPAMIALVRALRIGIAIYRPNHIVLSGGIGVRISHLLPLLRQMIDKNLTSLARPGWTLTTGNDDYHAARGAASLVTDAM